ncbi:hypothetical protein BT96DRAFT_989910 [Gymnopus androsaceus JB14]|uniref:Uncharacterized protein n=1 Tax=Gymnopus androsaceus JB14 TaxID=1447944 RepID=A0A6A4HX55_9AGAR|nr:hypothetical protein BT96DRAFT_989910 [Gymnopus androsaceus JB14]
MSSNELQWSCAPTGTFLCIRFQLFYPHLTNSTVDHGKSTLSDLLISKAGITSAGLDGSIQFVGSDEDNVRIKPATFPLYLKVDRDEVDSIKQKTNGDEFSVSLIESPVHVNFAGVPLNISDPFVPYCETVQAESAIIAVSKSQNNHNHSQSSVHEGQAYG